MGRKVGLRPVRVAQLIATGDLFEFLLLTLLLSNSRWSHSTFQPPLVTHLSTLTGGSDGVRVLVPLCGKAGCLLHLYNAGHTVVGQFESPVR